MNAAIEAAHGIKEYHMSKEAMKLELARLQARTDTADLDAIAALNEALAEQPAPSELTTISEDECLLDVDESAWRRLVEKRGGCRCHLSPPCAACSEPVTEAELNDVGYTYEQPAQQQEPVAIKYWLQDTTESGRWVTTDNMAKATAERMLSGEYGDVYPQGRIVEPSPPAQRKPLTDVEIWGAYIKSPGHVGDGSLSRLYAFAKAIEAAHGIKEYHMSKEAMKLALEVLETERNNYQDWDEKDGAPEYIYDAITALREALAEQPAQQEPVAWVYPDDYERMTTSETFCTVYSVEVGSATRGESAAALYTSPPAQRTWVDLTDEEAIECSTFESRLHCVEAANKKLEEKNSD